MKKNKGVIGIGLVIAIVLGIVVVGGGAYYLGTREPSRYDGNWDEWQEKYNEENKIIEENQATPVEEIKSNLINDEVLGISFKINSGAVAQKGASRCCPSVWTISDNSGDQDTIEQYVVGSADDPKLWKVVTNMGTKKFGSNTYNVYKRNDGLFDFTIIKNDKAFVVNSFSNPAKFVDLSSFTINSATDVSTENWKTYTNKVLGIEFNYPSTAKLEEVKLGRTDLKSGEVIIRLPFINQYDAWISKVFTVTSYNDSCKEYLPTSISQNKTINGISYVFVDPEWGATSGMSTISKWRKYYHESSSKCYIISETLSGLGNNERPSTATVPPNVDKFLESELADLDKIMSSIKIF